jgi:phosphohistidine phosphatase
MQLLLIRHAIAEDSTSYLPKDDAARVLTPEGQAKMQKAANGLNQQIEIIHYLVSSPLVRAQQTADIVASAFPSAIRETLSLLAPGGSFHGILDYLQQYQTTDTVALVGHEADLGELGAWLLSGQRGHWLPLKKGSVYLLEFHHQVVAGKAVLRWALTSKQLGKLAKCASHQIP